MYTEVQKKGNKTYFYRVKSVREKNKIKKIKKYLGSNLSPRELKRKEKSVDLSFEPLNLLLSPEEKEKLNLIKKKYLKAPKENSENIYESFLAQFIYDSNAIEGNTLSLQETSFILFEQRTPEGKSLREINEALNHKKAFDFILNYKENLNKQFICKLQELIVAGTLRKDLETQIGKYRNVQVYIRGAEFIPPGPKAVKKEMKTLLFWYTKNKSKLHPLILASYFHSAFESIHPFVDGNGRTGRLLINFILHKYGFPMINIPSSQKLKYYSCLESARKGNLKKFVHFLYNLMVSTKIHI